MNYTIEEIEEILRTHYDIEEDDEYSMECGCFVNGEWLSIRDILETIKKGY